MNTKLSQTWEGKIQQLPQTKDCAPRVNSWCHLSVEFPSIERFIGGQWLTVDDRMFSITDRRNGCTWTTDRHVLPDNKLICTIWGTLGKFRGKTEILSTYTLKICHCLALLMNGAKQNNALIVSWHTLSHTDDSSKSKKH